MQYFKSFRIKYLLLQEATHNMLRNESVSEKTQTLMKIANLEFHPTVILILFTDKNYTCVLMQFHSLRQMG